MERNDQWVFDSFCFPTALAEGCLFFNFRDERHMRLDVNYLWTLSISSFKPTAVLHVFQYILDLNIKHIVSSYTKRTPKKGERTSWVHCYNYKTSKNTSILLTYYFGNDIRSVFRWRLVISVKFRVCANILRDNIWRIPSEFCTFSISCYIYFISHYLVGENSQSSSFFFLISWYYSAINNKRKNFQRCD